MSARPFRQVDVFTTAAYRGNPVAVVLDGDGLSEPDMRRFANWTNLSETTYVLPPSDPAADYRLRIFTPSTELPFAGHPTLGSAHAWLEAGGVPRRDGTIVQECGAGLVELRRTADGLAFAGPALRRSGPVDAETLARATGAFGLAPDDVLDAAWADNGPGWIALLLADADAVLRLRRPAGLDLDVGLVGLHRPGGPAELEVRAFFQVDGEPVEDPVTGSLNAAVAAWLTSSGRLSAPYVARQGTALGRDGRVHITADADGTLWTGGGSVTCIAGTVELGP